MGFFFEEDFRGSKGLVDDFSSDCKTATLAAIFAELNPIFGY